MKELKQIYLRTKAFTIGYFIVFLTTAILLILFPKAQIHLFINHLNSPTLDIFFKYLTYLGSGWALVTALLLLAIIYKRKAGGLLLSALIFNFFVQLLKHTVKAYRPVKYFSLYYPDQHLHLVSGITQHYYNSFPSGHSATAMAIFFFLAFLTKRKWLQIIYLILAILIAYSRVYLSQHFLLDALIGSLIGYLSSYLGLWWVLLDQKVKN